MLYKDKRVGGKGMLNILLFLWAKYVSAICKLATEADTKTACLVRYFVGRILRHWGVFTQTNYRPRITEPPWFYETLNRCRNMYGLQNAGPATMKSHKKIQETVWKRDTTSPMDLLP